ncbi:hypothetical protein PRIPAC_75130 [Pristionchus pacificus]|uniref:Uncharacterized protein n=1 Tax=Pristionchus pacificus TaxID=54126 RepID=A0A2A6BGP3_PRIPA|nr:hypothetical protein PRIPAC_75130 [Pristionchus pacificus]|eukprot:PDM65050.1 hypothetical protein PRIPAC_53606 [Pristionchus pacificus]
MQLNLLDVGAFCVMENPLHYIANKNEVTNIFLVPISMEIKARRLIPQLKVFGLHTDENLHAMVEKKDHRLQRRAIDKEMNADLMDRILCGPHSNSDNNEHESYAIIKIIMNGDNYLIEYQCQGYSDEFSFSGDRSYNYHLGFEFDKKK